MMTPTTLSIAVLLLSVAMNGAQGRLLGTSHPSRGASNDHDMASNIQQLKPQSLHSHDLSLLLNNKDIDYSRRTVEHEEAGVSDGFSYLGKTADFNLKNLRDELPLDMDSSDAGVAIRFTADGDLYISNGEMMMPFHDNEVHDKEVPPSKGMIEDEIDDTESDKNNNDRDLFIIGPDDRTRVFETEAWPSRIVGALISPPNPVTGLRSLCTGTVISSNHILTAAHCVYDQATGSEKAKEGFAPGATMIDQNISLPFGYWEVESATIYNDYAAIESLTARSGDYDIAVVKIKPLDGFLGVGHVVGVAGLRQTDFDTPELQSSTITGYPNDKPALEMWTSADSLCTGSYEGTKKFEYIVRHDCDTKQGTSGAALMDGEGYVHGVNWGGVKIMNITGMNLGNILRGSRYTDIMNWSERTSNSPQT